MSVDALGPVTKGEFGTKNACFSLMDDEKRGISI